MKKNTDANNSHFGEPMETVARELRIGNVLGLHGRASARLVETASRFAADVRLVKEGEVVDAKSILDVMSVACV
ncbi:MAG: HPr family phosphocarrier protein, partial [Desulfobulbaceae bacterium]|nr:HPr family phosphocarrier protein [Desulfobulbaceae bacterium]